MYGPWGEVRGETGALPTSFQFTGQRKSELAGVHFFKARYYDSQAGVFLQPDSLVPDPYNPLDWNRFLYVRGNAINMVDPGGHITQKALFFDADVGINLLPPIPTTGLNPDGKKTLTNLLLFASRNNVKFDSGKLLGAVLYTEANAYWSKASSLIIEACVRKYNHFCQAGAWTSECINGFWAYYQPARTAGTNLGVAETMVRFLNNSLDLLYGSDYIDEFRTAASNITQFLTKFGKAIQENDKPSGWVNMCLSGNDFNYFSHYFSVPNGFGYINEYFVVTSANEVLHYTGSYYTNLSYRGCR